MKLKSCSGEVDNPYSNNYPHFNPFSRTGLRIEFDPFFDRIEKWIDFYPFGLIQAPEQDSGLKAYSSALFALVRIVFKQMSLLWNALNNPYFIISPERDWISLFLYFNGFIQSFSLPNMALNSLKFTYIHHPKCDCIKISMDKCFYAMPKGPLKILHFQLAALVSRNRKYVF